MGGKLRIAVGSDQAGFEYKETIKNTLKTSPYVAEVIDLGVDSNQNSKPYPYIGIKAGECISLGEVDRAVLICGTGLGVGMSAGKVPGIRAVTAHDSFSVERSILSNNCHVLSMGQRVVGIELAKRLALEWVGYTFDEKSPSAEKVKVLREYERKLLDGNF